MRKAAATFFVASLLVVSLFSFVGAEEKGAITGTVVDESGNPVSGVEIVVRDPATGTVVGNAVTDAQGKYHISSIPPGKYTLVFNPGTTGFQAGITTLEVGVEGMVVNWTASLTALPVATATAAAGGMTILGIAPGTAALLGVGGAAAGTGIGFAVSGDGGGGGEASPSE